jgi:DNA polymerase alpha-associated DNA helicase A
VARLDPASEAMMVNQRYHIKLALAPVGSETSIAERVLRDTDNLLLRSSDVTLATTSSHIIVEMIADGEQFDWVIVEEAARANGAELVGALLLGNRRIMVGDHNQLSPFDAIQRQKSTIANAQPSYCVTQRRSSKLSPICRQRLLRRSTP